MPGPTNIPAPQQIASQLYLQPVPLVPLLPSKWNAQLLLTPFGGLPDSIFAPSDQLVVANVSFDGISPNTALMRASMYSLESLKYYDLLFATEGGVTTWYWLVSDPSIPNQMPAAAFGPFATHCQVVGPSWLQANNFSYAGHWSVVGKSCSNFSAAVGGGQAGIWFSFRESDGLPFRIMNVDAGNDSKAALIGSYYLVNIIGFAAQPGVDLQQLLAWCKQNAQGPASAVEMVTLTDIQNALSKPPNGSQTPCTIKQIQAILPGISIPTNPTPPSWTNQVDIACYMIGQDTYPYFCHVWYDWDYGDQLTVFVQKGSSGDYDARLDELLPKGIAGPGVQYNWKPNAGWDAYCSDPQGSFVPMPRPDFVKAGGGKCRAVIANPAFNSAMTIWSVALGNISALVRFFWYWFDDQARGVIFSLAPASSLTMIDYQQFTQNATIPPAVFFEPTGLPGCGAAIKTLRKKLRFEIK